MRTSFRFRVHLHVVLSWVGLLVAGPLVEAGEQAKTRHTVPGVPYVQQSHRNTCGAAALAMLLQHHGKKTTEQDLIRAYPKVKRTGFYIPWLWQYSRKAGLKTISGTGTADGLKKLLRGNTPIIVYQRSTPARTRPHFRVVVGYDDERKVFIIWDPTPQLGKGHEISYQSFERLWQLRYYRAKTHFYFAIGPPEPISGEARLEKHATDEFVKYVAQITGAEPKVAPAGVCTLKKGKTRVAIGRNAITALLLRKRLVQVPEDLGEEGFVIKSAEDGGTKHLVLLGGSSKGTLYAVYHYLEKFCRVGFFADGEQVPKLDAIPVEGIDLVDRPRWPVRQYMMDCEYTSYWWGWEEWKREVDWAAKHRFNLLSSNLDLTATWRKVWKRFGVDVPPASLTAPPFHPWAEWHNWAMKPPYPEGFQDFQADLVEKFVRYGRSLGMKMVPDFSGFFGQVPRPFYKAYRDRARFIEAGWGGFQPTGVFIHPDDPLYRKVCKAYVEEYTKRYGTDHLWASQTYCEMRPGKNAQETLAIETACAKRNLEAIRAVDPKAVLFTTSWTFLSRSKENVKRYLEALPDDAFHVWDMCGDVRPGGPPLYKKLDYFFGKTWLLTFLYAYGGTTMLHGDLADLIKRAQDAAADPKAGKCLGMGIEPEALHHNTIVFDLVSRLAWNPATVKLDTFLEDYAVRRYGGASAPRMVECLKELIASVYGAHGRGQGLACPLYMVRITNKHLRPGNPYGVHQAKSFLPHLQKAIEIALVESERLGGSALYQHDLIDIARQFLSDLFDLHVARLARAFRAQDKASFEREARVLGDILTSQEMLLSSSDYFCLAPILAKARALPNAPEDFEERIRDILTVWGNKILDYAHRDYYELVRFYYRRRVEAFIKHAQGRFGKHATLVSDKELAPIYHEIEQAWVKKPFKVAKSERYAGTPVQAAAEVLRRHRLSGEELKRAWPFSDTRPQPGHSERSGTKPKNLSEE